MGEELRDVLPQLIINAAFIKICQLPKAEKSPLFFVQAILSISQQCRESSLFKNFPRLIIDAFAYFASKSNELDIVIRDRIQKMIAYYVSQQQDLKADSLYQRLDETTLIPLFDQLVTLSFFKRVRDNTDERYHKYLPSQE